MKKQIGKLLGRLKSTRRARSGRLRKLRLESLEGRRLLAADLAANHNYIIAEDVNQDFLVSPLDALLVINALNQGGSRSFGEGEVSAEMVAKLDVNGDNYLSPIDVLTVINRLNAEGEDTAEFIIAYSYEITDTNGAPLSGDVVVGDTFRINAYVKDNRDLGPNPDPQVSGVFGAASDLGVSDLSLVQYAPDGFFVPTRANEPHPITVGGHRVRIQGPTEWRFISMVDSAAAGAGTASYDAVTKTLTIAGDSSGATANALVIQDAISALPDFSASGALAAGDGTFTSGTTRVFGFGVTFGTELRNGRNASEGGGLQIAGFKTANVSDGQTFSLTTSSGTVRFEFDWNSDTQPGNTVIGLREPDTESPLGFNEVSSAIVAAVQASGLGLRPENSGDGVVGLPVDQFTLAPETSLLSVSMPASEYFNEITAFSRSSESDDPTVPVPFYSMDFRAEAAGVITFTPNQPDRAGSENLIFGSTIPIPNEMVMFGSPFSVTIIVDPTAPKANDDNVTTAEDTPLTFNGNITTNDTVTAGRTVTIDSLAAISGVTQGTVNGSTYTPPANFNGVDTLTYSVIDSTGLRSGQATVTIQVTAVNDPPVARNDFFSIEESSADNILNVLADNGTGADDGGPNEPGDTITITAVGATTQGGAVSIGSGGTSLLYTPRAGFLGTETFTYTIADGDGLTATATVTVEVEPSALPWARTDRASGPENTSISVNILDNDSLNDGATPILVGFSQGSFGSVSNEGNVLIYTPNDEHFYGTDEFSYILNDSSGLGIDSTATVTVTVTDVNDVPVLVDDTAAGTEDTPFTIPGASLLSNDSPGLGEEVGVAQQPQTLTLSSVTALTPGGGTVALVAGDVLYTPAQDFNGTFEFSYTASDNGSPVLSATATVTVTVSAVNDDPLAADDTLSGTEDTVLTIPAGGTTIAAGNLVFNDRPGPATATDEVNQVLTVTGVSASSTQGGSVSLDGTTVTYTPAKDFNGSDTFTYNLSDGAGGTATATVTVVVEAINDAPLAVSDSVTAFKEVPASISVAELLSNDSPGPANEAMQTLSIVAVQATADTHGQVVLNGDGTITFTPEAGYTGAASFEYTLQDSGPSAAPHRNTATGVVQVTVEEFRPSAISGTVWVDESYHTRGDNQIDSNEPRLGGVRVTLNGTSLGRAVATQTVMTLADGSYSFRDLGPGTYTVSYAVPKFMLDNPDVPDQYTVNIVAPGGTTASGYNFATIGLGASDGQPDYGRIIDQIVSGSGTNSGQYVGAYFAIAADNTQLWSNLREARAGVQFSEVVLAASGSELYLTIVDTNHQVFTKTLSRRDFIRVQDADGNMLIRILNSGSTSGYQQVDLSSPPAGAPSKYLDSVDAIFAQENWDL